MRTPMPRRCSHSIKLGTIPAAAGELGFEMVPTVLMMGMEEKLLVPFGAQDGAFDDAGFEPEFAHGALHPLARGPVECRIADDAAFADLAPAGFKLRLDQYNHLAAWP